MLTALRDAIMPSCGGKAAALGSLLRAGLPVPDGFVIHHDAAGLSNEAVSPRLRIAVARTLERLGNPIVAVRSSAANEDSAHTSAAGQYESTIGVQGTARVCESILACRASAHTARVQTYWGKQPATLSSTSEVSVIVQRMIAADVAGVLFTPSVPHGSTRIEASWGLGASVVGGAVTPDSYEITPLGSVIAAMGSKRRRFDLDPSGGVRNSPVPLPQQTAPALDHRTARALTNLGSQIAEIQGGPQDVEWAMTGGTIWIVQARPITAPLPTTSRTAIGKGRPDAMAGMPASPGSALGIARLVRSPSDFPSVRPGDVIVCRYTDPAWTPLFSIASGVITETGGVLSHAAIVAREYGIPAVLGVTDALRTIPAGRQISLDGAAGTITVH